MSDLVGNPEDRFSRVAAHMRNGLAHQYHLGEPTIIFRGTRSDFEFLFHFSMKFLETSRKAPDGTPRSVASHQGLYCLPMSYKKGRQA